MRFWKNGQKIPINTLLKLVESLPRKVEAVVAARADVILNPMD